MQNPTKNDIDILFSQDDQTLAGWWLLLNKWGWPKELPDPEPTLPVDGGRRVQLMDLIERAIGNRLISKLHCKEFMTDEEFAVFYKAESMGCKEYEDEYWKQLTERADRPYPDSPPMRLTAIGERQLHWATRAIGKLFEKE